MLLWRGDAAGLEVDWDGWRGGLGGKGGCLELRHLGDIIWALLKFILLNQTWWAHIHASTYSTYTPHIDNAHTCTCTAQSRNLQTSVAKHAHDVSFCLSDYFHSLESIPAVTRWEAEIDLAQFANFSHTSHSKLTFDSDVDGLRDEELWLDQHAADVRPLVHPLLNIAELQRSVLKHHLHRWQHNQTRM